MDPADSMFPVLRRRELIRLGPLSVTGGFLGPLGCLLHAAARESITPRGSADCVVFVNLCGSPSQMDTFDVKEAKWTPEDLDIRTTKLGYRWPYGLMPKLPEVLQHAAVVRSMAAWETLHTLGQFYQQVGHQFNAARAKEMPSIGSVIAYETLTKAKESDFLPPFVSMSFPASNVNGALIREGFLDSSTSPLTIDLNNGLSVPFVLKPEEKTRLERKLELLNAFESSRPLAGPGAPKRLSEWKALRIGSLKMMRSPKVAEIFTLPESERARYGGTPFGDSCLITRNLVAASAGVRYILLNQDGWDHHGQLYGKGNAARGENPMVRGGLYKNCYELDRGVSALIEDLARMKDTRGNSLLARTFVVCVGEFGRTPGELNDVKGRDHWPDVRCGLFFGGGVKGGRVIGQTDELASKITRFDWSKNRPIYPEDLTATIYSALGIDWTKRLKGAPSGRDFEYVEPMSGTTYLGSTELSELFT
jgi:hypothetical protein